VNLALKRRETEKWSDEGEEPTVVNRFRIDVLVKM
jgi:hypothetical protein